MRRVADIETLVTSNDKEALILENNLIKQYKPRYNIRLKDDKSYLSIKVTTQHAWPRILATRKIVKDGNRYFGPFSSALAARETIDIIEKHFQLRNCTDHNFRNRTRPCLQYQIKRCMGPCVLPVAPDVYREQVRQTMLFIEGRQQELIDELKQRMSAKGRRPGVRGGGADSRPDPGGREDLGETAHGGALGQRPGYFRPVPRGRFHRSPGSAGAPGQADRQPVLFAWRIWNFPTKRSWARC